MNQPPCPHCPRELCLKASCSRIVRFHHNHHQKDCKCGQIAREYFCGCGTDKSPDSPLFDHFPTQRYSHRHDSALTATPTHTVRYTRSSITDTAAIFHSSASEGERISAATPSPHPMTREASRRALSSSSSQPANFNATTAPSWSGSKQFASQQANYSYGPHGHIRNPHEAQEALREAEAEDEIRDLINLYLRQREAL